MFKIPQFRLHFIVLLWGFTGILGKLITINALSLVCLRMLVALITVFLYLAVTNRTIRISKSLILKLLGLGTILAAHWFLFFYTIKIANVSIALSCLSTGALFTALLEPFFFKRRILKSEIILSLAIVLCICSIFTVEISYWKGLLCGILCSLLSALFSVFNGKIHERTSPGTLMFYELLGGLMMVFLILCFAGGAPTLLHLSGMDWFWMLILGSFLTAYPMIESVRLMKHFTPFTLVLTENMEPVYGIILAYFIFGKSEQMSPLFYGVTLCMIATIVTNGILKKRATRNLQSNA